MTLADNDARKRLSARKGITAWVLVVLLAWLLPGTMLHWAQMGFYEFQAPLWVAQSHIQDLIGFWYLKGHSKDKLIEMGIELARVNAALTLELHEVPELREDIALLEAILELPPYEGFRSEIARVIRRDINCWWHEITIRKGANQGIQPGNGVIFSGGVVGRVSKVLNNIAVIELISSPRLRMAAHIEADARPVLYQGLLNNTFSTPQGVATGVPADITVPTGSWLRLEASALGGDFPEGLTLGWIRTLEPSADGLFQHGKVQLPAQLATLREVAVLIPAEAIAQEAPDIGEPAS
ncbi:MAG: hypothetical protein B7X06_01020 [Verrucomicrobia bacterium 21-51-4]|nr:MAG: hypothetical protein B7X06_01020 [Verrucomicrobia bacterium 21-51-4]HQU08826.1 rod shape-determining protein MreC [Opitutales bacterium]